MLGYSVLYMLNTQPVVILRFPVDASGVFSDSCYAILTLDPQATVAAYVPDQVSLPILLEPSSHGCVSLCLHLPPPVVGCSYVFGTLECSHATSRSANPACSLCQYLTGPISSDCGCDVRSIPMIPPRDSGIS